MNELILGTTEAAFRLRCSPERVRQLVAEGKLKAERTSSGHRVFRESEVDRFAKERALTVKKKRVTKVA